MTKDLILIFVLSSLIACKEAPVASGTTQNPPFFKKSDLKKNLGWIKGNWKSAVLGPGYYQTCHFPSDTSLEVISYRFDGKDTSGTTISIVYWKNGHIYLGPYGEWVAVMADKKTIQFDPIRSDWHSINWTQNSKDEWTSVQKKPTFERTINMKRQPPLEKLLKGVK